MNSEELLSILIQLSKADSYFDEFEFTYLLKVGKNIGLEDEVVETMIKSSTVLPLTIPKNEKERITIIYYMLFLMKVNHVIKSEEKELLHHYGFKLGFSAGMIDDFIKVIEGHKAEQINKDLMLNILRKYQN